MVYKRSTDVVVFVATSLGQPNSNMWLMAAALRNFGAPPRDGKSCFIHDLINPFVID